MTNAVSLFGHAILDLLFPPRCEVCGELQTPVICSNCFHQFEQITAPFCEQCGLPLDPRAQTMGHCVQCNTEPPPFDAARSAGIYCDALRHAIHRFKYDMVRALARPLGDYMARHIDMPFAVDMLCPVPLHPARERMRGFNQSSLLAERLGVHWHLPVQNGLMVRTHNTTPQMQLPHDKRLSNLRGAFQVTDSVAGCTVAVVDDVFTTGSTLCECSRVLKRAGASRVMVLSLARTVLR
jgi:ComF family protein